MTERKLPVDAGLDSMIADASRGDEAACAAIYYRFVKPLFRLAYGILLNQQDAEEVVQDAFSYAFRNLANYDSNLSAFRTWLYTIAISRCRNKKRRKWLPLLNLSEISNRVEDRGLPPERVAEQRSVRRELMRALRQISPKLREAVVLRYFDGLSYREMGQVLACPQKTAESRVRLAHDALHSILKGHAGSLLEGILGYDDAR